MQDYTTCSVNNDFKGSFQVDSQNVCGELKWINGQSYSKSNKTVFHNAKYQNGLDSFVLLHLVVNPFSISIDSQTACNSYTWMDGNTYNESTDFAFYTIPNAAANGCDSMIYLKLTILKSSIAIDSQTACNSYTWMDGNTYNESTDFAFYTIPNAAANGCDSMIYLKLTILKSSIAIDSQTACNSYTWIDGNTYNESTDFAFYTIPNAAANGCDSILFLNLNVIHINGTIMQDSSMLKVLQENAMYQWGNCGSVFNSLDGEVNQSFFPKNNGHYAVAIIVSDCVDTSDCYSFSGLSNLKSDGIASFSVYPNPSNGIFFIHFSSDKLKKYRLTDALGNSIQEGIFLSTSALLSLENEKSGVYFLQVEGVVIRINKID